MVSNNSNRDQLPPLLFSGKQFEGIANRALNNAVTMIFQPASNVRMLIDKNKGNQYSVFSKISVSSKICTDWYDDSYLVGKMKRLLNMIY
jgi:hypothetical protein